MVERKLLIEYCDELLNSRGFSDYGPNGLQVEGREQIQTLISGVSASQALLDAAVNLHADAILVHHGYFWKGESPCVVGMKQRRLKTLLCADINLIGYHLPLDAHPELGNNAQLAGLLGLEIQGAFAWHAEQAIGLHGKLKTAATPNALTQQIESALGRTPLHIDAGRKTISRVAWCSGAAQSHLDEAVELGVDAFITGEISEYSVHVARERGIHFYAAGHHATERYGVQALGAHLAQKFAIQHHFIDIDNPV